MRTSQYLLGTVKQTPADAVVVSHQLMLRAGMVRKLASGLYTWLPSGLRVLRKVERIIREEMDRAGAQEVLMPVVQPMELWEESGRAPAYGPELLRFTDRHDNPFCLGPTHEEVITDLVRNEIHSYKQLPANFYQIQTKFRDEIRPRFGIMRAREFTMKDAYSFHTDMDSLAQTYQVMHNAYCAIFDRLGLDYRPVEADTGAIGGAASHEFHVLAESGEDDIAFSDQSGYAANVELAEAVAPAGERAAPGAGLGLAMVKRLAEAMGGEVGLTSTPGEGALFWFAFPLEGENAGEPAGRPLAGCRLVVASPCPIQREGVRLQAEALGASVECAREIGAVAGAIASAGGDVVVVLDEVWAECAASLANPAGALHVLALAQPRTKDLFSQARRPAGIDGWLVAPVRARSLAEHATRRGPQPAPQEVQAAPEAAPAPAQAGPLAGLNLLLAEDDPVNGLIGERVLARLGAAVTRVEDGEAAVRAVREARFDAVLLDLRMPKLDGRGAARAIRALPGGEALALLALTANATEADRAACLAAGMDDFLSKPLDPEKLTGALARLCKGEKRARVG